MGNHPFNVIVIVFWLATMTWLMVAKVLPPLRVGEPPSYSSILKNKDQAETPTCWSVRLNDQPLGWAATKAVRRKDGITEIYSRVYLRDLPLEEIAPPWLSDVLRPLLGQFGQLDIDKRSLLTIDPLGRLVALETKVRVADIPDAIKVQGQVEGSVLTLSVTSGGVTRKLEQFLPPDALMTDELSPQASMPGLRVGQTWTVPLYSPFRSPSTPMEILQATVEDRHDKITWNGRRINSRVIVYRNDAGSGLIGTDTRGRVWVGDDGLVLRQEISVFRSRVHFVRLAEGQADDIVRTLDPDWMSVLSRRAAARLLQQVQALEP
jgi:hypothetical protein